MTHQPENEPDRPGLPGTSLMPHTKRKRQRRWLFAIGMGLGVLTAGLYAWFPFSGSIDPTTKDGPDIAGVQDDADQGAQSVGPSSASKNPPLVPADVLVGPPPAPPNSALEICEQAGELAEQLTADFPDNPDSYHVAADASFWQGDSDRAVACWEKCLELEPRYAYAHHGIGKVAAKKGHHKKAVESFRKALTLGPTPPDTEIELAWALIHLGELDEAIAELNAFIAAGSPPARAFFLLGTAHLQSQDYENARGAFQQAIDIAPGWAEPYYSMAAVCRRLGQIEEAEGFVAKLKELVARDRRVLETVRSQHDDLAEMKKPFAGNCVNAARLYQAAGNSRETARLLQMATALDPANLESRQGLAWLYKQQNRIPDAIRMLEELANIEPENPAYHEEIGRLRAGDDRHVAAEDALDKASAISDNGSTTNGKEG